MELITTDFQQSIKIGELEAFKKTVDSMIEVTARNEPDTLSYNWFINEEGTECHLLETFKDSEAFITHLNNSLVSLSVIPLSKASCLSAALSFNSMIKSISSDFARGYISLNHSAIRFFFLRLVGGLI